MEEFKPKNGDIIEYSYTGEIWRKGIFIGMLELIKDEPAYVVYDEEKGISLPIMPFVRTFNRIKSPIVLSCLNITGRGAVLVVNDEETYNTGDKVWYDDVIYVVTAVECSGMGKWINTSKGLVVKKYIE